MGGQVDMEEAQADMDPEVVQVDMEEVLVDGGEAAKARALAVGVDPVAAEMASRAPTSGP